MSYQSKEIGHFDGVAYHLLDGQSFRWVESRIGLARIALLPYDHYKVLFQSHISAHGAKVGTTRTTGQVQQDGILDDSYLDHHCLVMTTYWDGDQLGNTPGQRFTVGTKDRMNGWDVMSLRMILGHTDLSVTQVYMHLAQSHIQIQHQKFSPLDMLGIKPRRRGEHRLRCELS